MESIDLSAFFITKSQALDFGARLTKVMDTIYTTDFNLEKAIADQFGLQKKELLLKLLRENGVSETTPTTIQAFLKNILDTIAKLPIVTLTIAFEPTDETLRVFSEWFLFTLKKQVLFSLEIDKSLLAGARITCNGKYKDYSIQTTFITLMDTMLHPKPAAQPATTPPHTASTGQSMTASAPSTH